MHSPLASKPSPLLTHPLKHTSKEMNHKALLARRPYPAQPHSIRATQLLNDVVLDAVEFVEGHCEGIMGYEG